MFATSSKKSRMTSHYSFNHSTKHIDELKLHACKDGASCISGEAGPTAGLLVP